MVIRLNKESGLMAPVTRDAWVEQSAPERVLRGFGELSDSLLGPRGCLFTFHRGAPAERWENLANRGFHLDLDYLDRLLTYLRQNGWAIVTVDEALRRLATGNSNGRYVNFSIDDGYRDTFEDVVPVFRRHGVPVTIFVTTGIPDGTLPLAHAGLEDVLGTRDKIKVDGEEFEATTPDAKRQLYAQIAMRWEGPRQGEHYAAFCRDNDIDEDAMHLKHAISWDMLEALRDDPCVEIGAHTVTHARISALAEPEAYAEIKGCRDRLMDKLGIDIRHFAFPYGRSGDCGQRDFALTRQAGFSSAATTTKGLMRKGQDYFSLPRNTLNGAHRHPVMAQLHLSGATGLAAKVMGRV
jgi:peptidoglycan/xylan/chitin deacetylase (PgdA/CDA1 family)